MVGNTSGSAPAATTPRDTASINSGTRRWQLLKPLAVLAMPITGRSSMARE